MSSQKDPAKHTAEAGAELFAALADPTRLRLASLILQNGEICVCDLIAITGLPQSRISKHLAILRRIGMVAPRREGTWLHYAMVKPKDPLTEALLNSVKAASDLEELKTDTRNLKRSDCCSPKLKSL